MPIATQADVAAAAQVTFDTDPDPRVTAAIQTAQSLIEIEVGIIFDSPPAPTELRLTGDGSELVTLPVWPIASVTSVFEDDVELTFDEDYWWKPNGALYRLNGGWSLTRHGIIVTYTPGWANPDDAPRRFRDLVARVASRLWRNAVAWAETSGAGGVKQETIGSYSATYRDGLDEATLTDSEGLAAHRLRRRVGSEKVH